MGLQLFEFSWAFVSWLTSGLVNLVCLVWLLKSTPQSALRNSFAILLAVLFLTTGPLLALLWVEDGRTYWPFEIGDNMLGLASLLFLITWLAAQRGRPLPRWLPVPFLLAMAATAAVWWLAPELRFETVDGGADRLVNIGTIFVLEQVLDLSVAIAISLLFMQQALRRDAVAFALAGFGFCAFTLVNGAGGLVDLLQGELDGGREEAAGRTEHLMRVIHTLTKSATFLYLVAAVAYIVLRAPPNRARRVICASVFPVGGLALLLAISWASTQDPAWYEAGYVLSGLASILFPVFGTLLMVAEANVSQESRLWTTIRRASVPAVMLVTFYVVSEGVQGYLSGALGPLVGVLATVPIILLLTPIQRLADRFGRNVAPAVAQQPMHEREALYERQLRYAWVDGRINATERARMVDLRRALGIAAERAEAIEETIIERTPSAA